MAASEETCAGNPNFAIICSFITNFGNDCGVNISIPYLQEMLEDTKTVHQDLLEIILHLMRRGKKRIIKERWEKCLVKFCHEYSSVDAWEIERFGFLKSKLSVKLELLKRLLELQFDANAKFKAEVNKHDADTLRLLPIGRDIDGQAYWYQLDKEFNMRLYRETISEESSWQLLCSTTEDLKTLINSLEKKYSCSEGDTCEDKLNDPKSPSSDMPVPKKEQDVEEMTSCLSESKPCTIIIKTEKKELSDTPVKSESCAIIDDVEPENTTSDNNTKGSVKLKLKLECSSNSKNEQNSNKTVVEYSIVSEKHTVGAVDTDNSKMDIDKPTENTESVLNKDIEMKNVEKLSADNTSSVILSEEHSDQNIPNNSKTDIDIEKSDSVNHKSSKIKLYEKWSNEKKKLDASDTSAKESSFSSKNMVESKEQLDSLTVNKINEPAIPAKIIPEQSIKDQKLSIDNQNVNPDPDIAVDLSKSSRVNVIVQNTNSKPVCSNDAPSALKSSAENSVSTSDNNSNNLKMTKNSELEKSPEKPTDLKKKSLESESGKDFGRSKVFSKYYDVSRISDSSSTSGFSHLQALQNMCETNSMGGIPSVIQSTNRLKVESNKTIIGENKSLSNTVIYENMSNKYNFSDATTKNNSNDHEASNVLLKSNVHIKTDLDKQNSKFLDKNTISDFKESVSNESNISEVQPEDLSSQTVNKSENSESKTDSNCNLNEKHPVTLKAVSETDQENEKSANKKCILLIGKDLDAPKLSPCYSNECDSSENNTSVSDSSKEKAPSTSSVKNKSSGLEEAVIEPCNEKTTELCSKSAIQTSEINDGKIDASSKSPKSDNLPDGKCAASSLDKKIISESESTKKLHKSDDDEKMCSSSVPASQKSSTEPKIDLVSSVKESCIDSSESLFKDTERKFSVFSKVSLKSNDSVLYDSKVKTPSEVKIFEESGSESKDSLGGPPDLKESFNSIDCVSGEYKSSSPLNESEISEPPLLLKADLKPPVNDSKNVSAAESRNDNVEDKICARDCSADIENEKKKTGSADSKSVKTSNADKDKSQRLNPLVQCESKKCEKDNEIASETSIENKRSNKSNKSNNMKEIESNDMKEDLIKSKDKSFQENLNSKNIDSESDNCKIQSSESGDKALVADSVISSEELKTPEKESLPVTEHDLKKGKNKGYKGKENIVQPDTVDEKDNAENKVESDNCEDKPPEAENCCNSGEKDYVTKSDSKDSSENIIIEKVNEEPKVAEKQSLEHPKGDGVSSQVDKNQSLEHSKNDGISSKDDKNSECKKEKLNETSSLENVTPVDTEKNQIALDEMNSEDSSKKSDKQADAKKQGDTKSNSKRKSKISRKTPVRRNTRRTRTSYEEIEVDCQIDGSSKEDKKESKECSVNDVTVDESSSNMERKIPLKTPESSKSAINLENTYEMQFKIYNLRHSTCLESKFKHPLFDKYVKNPVPVLCIDISNNDIVSPTKARPKGKNTKQPVSKKPQPAAKPTTPAKKTPPSNSKKKPPKPPRNQKKNEVQKDDFAIPEGFLEILDKGASGKKRKGIDLKIAIDSHNSSDNESTTPRKRSRRIQEQHQKKMTELAVEMEREQRMLEQMAKRSNNNKKNNKSTPQKTPEKPNIKGPAAKNTPKVNNTPTKPAKSPRAVKTPAIIPEEDTLMDSKRTTRKMNSRSKNLTKMTLLYEDESKDSNFSTSRETEKSKKKRRRKRHRKGGFKPWDVSSESSSSIEVFTEEEEEEPDEPLIFEVNEDEFACEEVDPNAEPVIVRRARTAKKIVVADAEEECINDDTPCQKCGKYDKPEWILLCDKCDKGYHTHCLIPPLMIVPDGDWFCQPCEHLSLCQCLHEELNKLEVILKQREREALRKQRLAYVGISLDNVLKPEKKEKSDESAKEDKEVEQEEEDSEVKEKENRKAAKTRHSLEDERTEKLYGKRSVRARRNVNYQFKEYDELIFSALQEDMIEVPEEFKEMAGSEAGSDKPFTAKIPKRKKKSRRWTNFDSSEEDDSEDEYQGGSSDSEATAPPSSVSEQESGSGEEWKISRSSGGRKKTSQRKSQSRRRRRRRGRDSSEEDWEDEVVEKEAYRPTTRRAAQKAVSYREISSEEEDEWGAPKHQISSKRRKASSSESEASFKKKISKKKRIRKWGSSESSEESDEKSMSSSGESEEEDEDGEEEKSENECKDNKNEQTREKLSVKKKVLNSDEDEEEEEEERPTTKESIPRKKIRKVVSEESEEEEEDEEEEEEEEDEEEEEEEDEEEEESESEEESEDNEKRVEKKTIPEKKVSATDKQLNNADNKEDAEKKDPLEKLSNDTENNLIAMDKEESLSITEKSDFQPKVLVKKELCSVSIPLELNKPAITITPVNDKTLPKTARKEATKMVPCVIPYEKFPKGSQASTCDDDADKYTSKEEETPRHPLSSRPPIHIPKQGAVYAPPPSSRIQYSGVLPRHSIPPISSPVRPSIPSNNLQSRMLAPTNLSTRPAPSSVVVQHSSASNRMPLRSPVPVNKPIPPSAAPTPSKQTVSSKPETKPYKSTIMEPFSNMDDENDSDDEVPLERIPTAVPAPPQNRPVSYERDAEYRPAAKELSSYSYAPPDEKQYSGSYSTLSTFQDFSTRPSPLKPSLVETYPNNSSPSKLTPLDSYSRTNSPKGFISLDSYSENKKKKHFFGNSSQEGEPSQRPVPPSSENYQGGEIRFPPEPYPCPQSPNSFSHRSPPPNQRDSGTPPRLYSQFPDAYAPPRSPEYYQNHQYYASEERIPRPSYQPNYVPPEPSFVSNPYVATPVPQPNGGFMIDTLLQARNHENEDELTGVTDIVSYITQE